MPHVFRLSIRSLAPGIAALVLGSAPAAFAAANYYVYLAPFNQGSGPDPIHLSREYTVSQSIVRSHGYATPGSLGIMAEVESHFVGPFSDGAGTSAQVQESADDFVISGGPDPWVNATFYFMASTLFSAVGGFPGHGSNGGTLSVSVSAGNLSTSGTAYLNNGGSGATGALAGFGPSGGVTTIALTGAFPVGPRFSVFMGMTCDAYTYGNGDYSPATGRAAGGVYGPGPGVGIGNGNAIMDLPPGYTVNSPGFGVVNNQYLPLVGVPVATCGFDFEPAVPNPSAAQTRVAFTLPVESDASLTLVDVQGREVRSLALGRLGAGRHEFTWDGRDASGALVPAGVYFAIARSGGERSVQRLVRSR